MSNFSIYLSSILKSEVFSIILELPIKSRDFVLPLLDSLIPLLLLSSSTHPERGVDEEWMRSG